MSEGLEQALSRALRSVFAFTEAGGHYFSSIAYEDWLVILISTDCANLTI